MALGEVFNRGKVMSRVLKVFLSSLMCISLHAGAKVIEGVEFPETAELNGQKLVLNGAGLRTKRKLGVDWNVYVAGLYAQSKTSDAQALIQNSEPKILDLVFLRSVDKDTLREAWSEGFAKNCKAGCAESKKSLDKFNALMVDVKDKSHLKIKFEKDTVDVAVTGKTNSSGNIQDLNFSKALMAIFIGDIPPTEQLKTGLLGK